MLWYRGKICLCLSLMLLCAHARTWLRLAHDSWHFKTDLIYLSKRKSRIWIIYHVNIMYKYIYTCTHLCMYVCIHNFTHTLMRYIRMNIPVYIHTLRFDQRDFTDKDRYIHTCIHTYIYVYLCIYIYIYSHCVQKHASRDVKIHVKINANHMWG